MTDERTELNDYSWGVFLGFIFFFARKLYAYGILHLALLTAAVIVISSAYFLQSANAKWYLLAFVVAEIALLSWFGRTSTRASFRANKWSDPHKFISSNKLWDSLGRFLFIVRVLNVIAFVFFDKPYTFNATPPWVVLAGMVCIPVAVILLVWRIRGPIWSVALNTLKESISKLEVVILFVIGVVFVIMFNIIWLIPAVQDAVVNSPMLQGEADKTSTLQGPVEGKTDLDVSTTPQTKAFTAESVNRGKLRLVTQAAAFLFGEFFIALICFTLGISLIKSEIQRGVILTVLPKPIGRGEYVLGKILGGWLIVIICFEAMAFVALLFAIPYHGTASDNIPNVLHAMLLMPLKYAILLAMIAYLSLWLPEAVAGIFGVSIFIAGHFSQKIIDLALDDFSALPMVSLGVKAAYVLIPHLSEVASVVVLDPDQSLFESIAIKMPWGMIHTSAGFMLEWGFWAAVYLAIILTLAVYSFRKRSL